MNILKNSKRYLIIININIVIKIILLLRWIKIVSNDFNIIIYASLHLKSDTYKLASQSMTNISWSCRLIWILLNKKRSKKLILKIKWNTY